MGMIDLDSRVLNDAISDLTHAATLLELQSDSLGQIAGIVEGAWNSENTGTLCSCIHQTKQKLSGTAGGIKGASNALMVTYTEAKAIENTANLVSK